LKYAPEIEIANDIFVQACVACLEARTKAKLGCGTHACATELENLVDACQMAFDNLKGHFARLLK